MTPEIILGWGASPVDQAQAAEARWDAHTYIDCSTVIIMPTRGLIPARVVDTLMSMLRPPNSKTTQLFMAGLEVADAYNAGIETILNHPELSTWPFILTVEEDNLIPPLALIQLLREMNDGGWDVLGGLYWTKGTLGVPQIWGDANDPVWNFRPQKPVPGATLKCNGTGMGCTLFRTDVFRRLDGPWFKTQADEGGAFTQDLYAFHRWHNEGVELEVGVDCSVLVGHYDHTTGRVW